MKLFFLSFLSFFSSSGLLFTLDSTVCLSAHVIASFVYTASHYTTLHHTALHGWQAKARSKAPSRCALMQSVHQGGRHCSGLGPFARRTAPLPLCFCLATSTQSRGAGLPKSGCEHPSAVGILLEFAAGPASGRPMASFCLLPRWYSVLPPCLAFGRYHCEQQTASSSPQLFRRSSPIPHFFFFFPAQFRTQASSRAIGRSIEQKPHCLRAQFAHTPLSTELLLVTCHISQLGMCFVIRQIALPPAAVAFSPAASPKVSRNARELIGPRRCALTVPIKLPGFVAHKLWLGLVAWTRHTHWKTGVQRVSIGMGFYTTSSVQQWPDGDPRIPVAPFISCVMLPICQI